MMDPNGMRTRKIRHIHVCLTRPVSYQAITTGLGRYRLPYDALTHTSLDDIELATDFLGADHAARRAGGRQLRELTPQPRSTFCTTR